MQLKKRVDCEACDSWLRAFAGATAGARESDHVTPRCFQHSRGACWPDAAGMQI